MKKALLVIDCQYDFMECGSLEVPGANEIIPVINKLLPMYDIVIFTRDYHPSNHKSFASQHEGKKPFDIIKLNGIDQVLWPDHCVQGNRGSDIHEDIEIEKCKEFYIFKKGMNIEVDSYSGFYDNGHKTSTGLRDFLYSKNIDSVMIVGLSGDYCVKYTALDAVSEGYSTAVDLDGVRFIAQGNDKMSHLDELWDGGVITTSLSKK